MNTKGKIDPRELKIQGLVDGFLRVSNTKEVSEKATHLDEDTLTAFVEGNLTEKEANPVTSHLVDCSFCRHITAELVKLDLAFSTEETTVAIGKPEPTKVSEVLNGILSRIFGTSEGAVFAHQESDEDENDENAKVKKDEE